MKGGKNMLQNIEMLSKEELMDAVRALEVKLSALEKENQELRELAEVGKKYAEHLRAEATKFVKIVEGEKSALLKLIEKADIDTLKDMVDDYKAKAAEKLQSKSVQIPPEQTYPNTIKKEDIEKMSYEQLKELGEKLKREVMKWQQ
jgi:lysyl-tRNA synthetase class I